MPHRQTPLYQAMFSAVSQTLENMAFVEVTAQPEDTPKNLGATVNWVSMLIHDPFQGEIRLAMSASLLRELTANMFGLETDEVSQSQQQDIIAEILNTLTGLFMTALLPDDQTYQLGLPEHGAGEFPPVDEDSIAWNLEIEGQPLVIIGSGAGLLKAEQV